MLPVHAGAAKHAPRDRAAHLDRHQGDPDARLHGPFNFFFIMLQLRAHAAEAAVKLLSWRDELNSTAHAVAYPCCMCCEQWV